MTAISERPRVIVSRARDVLADSGRCLRNARVLVVGVTYKPGVCDVRESPALAIIEMIAAEGAHVSYTDPYVDAVEIDGVGVLTHQPLAAEERWDLVIVHTNHPDVDHSWLADQQTVLDTTYRIAHLNDHLTP